MSAIPRRLSYAVLAMLTSWLFLIATIKAISPEPDYSQTLPEECGEKSLNCAGFGKWSHRMEEAGAIVFEGDMGDARDSVREWVTERDRSTIVHSDNDTFHVVETTFLLRFEDDLVIHIECSDGLTIIHGYSSSRIGISDLGVNPERLDSLISHLEGYESSGNYC
ncbi:MAG: DUF1499 domain-containing protein [Candidatus Thalassarchaeaceae archaeon]